MTVTFGRGLETLSTLDRILTVDREGLMLIAEWFDLDLTLELQWLKSLKNVREDTNRYGNHVSAIYEAYACS